MLDGVMDEADLDGENSFDKLFSRMKLMKGVYDNNCTHELNYNKAKPLRIFVFFHVLCFSLEKAESLPHAERKAYAEQVSIYLEGKVEPATSQAICMC